MLVGAQLYRPDSWLRIIDPASFMLDPHSSKGQTLLRLVPNGTTVVTQTEFFVPFYATHQHMVIEFNPHENYTGRDDYVLEVKGDVYMFGDTTRTYYKIHRSAWEYWRASGYFDTLAEQDGYFVLKRKPLAPLRTPLKNGLVLIGSPTSQFQVDDKWGLVGYMDKLDSFLRRADIRFGNELVLSGYRLVPNDTAQGGETVHTVVQWRATQDIHTQFTMVAQVLDVNGHVWAQDSRDPVYGLVPTQHWKTGDLIRDQYTFALPVEMPPGTYRITLSVWDQAAGKSLPTYNEAQQSTGIEVVLGTITVRKNTNSIPGTFLTIESPLSIDLNEIRLLGSTSIPKAVRAGDDLSLGLYWRARSKPAGDYTVVVQVRDSAKHIAFEQADRPAAGAYPTTLWQVGEILLDWHDVTLPANLPAGDYIIMVLLRKPVDVPPAQVAQDGLLHRAVGDTSVTSAPRLAEFVGEHVVRRCPRAESARCVFSSGLFECNRVANDVGAELCGLEVDLEAPPREPLGRARSDRAEAWAVQAAHVAVAGKQPPHERLGAVGAGEDIQS